VDILTVKMCSALIISKIFKKKVSKKNATEKALTEPHALYKNKLLF